MPLILGYANSLHASTIAETGRWGATLLAEMAKFQKTIQAKESGIQRKNDALRAASSSRGSTVS
jgi:hypothetical protein